MKLLICMITYNRLEYSQKTLSNLLETIKVPHYIVVVDNNSSDGTQEWLKEQKKEGLIDMHILNQKNYYPGKAANSGWAMGLIHYPEATHLMRLDNDMHLEPGWDAVVEKYFKKIPELGQLGLDHEAIEHPKADLRVMDINGVELNPWPGCVGGPNIIRKTIWDLGVRYPEMMWNDGRNSPLQEDSQFSKAIMNKGYLAGHTQVEIGRTFANKDNWADFPDYYLKTMKDRGYNDHVEFIEWIKE